ncbi:uncharacterized protein LOC100866210 [Anopheles sinensis]|uniref:Uncharacterized protein LOC100866210 n=1 Tax=Anopheles sinensis TaxID=74873 RepID=A0A084WRW0_ANOSI|nr:uncharacterized protein LOC100866210 [Anopheles sinensis]
MMKHLLRFRNEHSFPITPFGERFAWERRLQIRELVHHSRLGDRVAMGSVPTQRQCAVRLVEAQASPQAAFHHQQQPHQCNSVLTNASVLRKTETSIGGNASPQKAAAFLMLRHDHGSSRCVCACAP